MEEYKEEGENVRKRENGRSWRGEGGDGVERKEIGNGE
jgi:hypothetical protein